MPTGGRGRRRHMEPTRTQLGAWDDPQISLFAIVPQEPLADMLGRLKQLPVTERRERNKQMDACPLMMAQSPSTNRLYREVKYQVAQIADDRNRNYNPITERERQSALIASMMADHNRREFAEAMRRKQLQTNAQRIRDLRIELERVKTSMSVTKMRDDNFANRNSAHVQEHQEAIEHRAHVQAEKEAEQLARHKKAHDFSDQLVLQIRTRQAERDRQQQTDREEGQQKRQRDGQAYANHLQQMLEWRHEKRKELKAMLDEFGALQRKLRAEEAEKYKPKLNVIVTEALGSVTRDFQRKKEQENIDGIERRRLIADQLGRELLTLKRKQDAHDSMLADILACERQAREKKRHQQDVEKREQQKHQVAKDLIQQQKEQKLYQEQEDALYKALPSDATSFMQRQYQQAKAREEFSRKINMAAYKGVAIGALENVQHRAAAIEEDRLIRKALHDMEVEMDRRIDEERMRVLKAQPPEIINGVRPCKLTKTERRAFNLPKCGLLDEDTPEF